MDTIYKSLAGGGAVALSVLKTTDLVQEGINIHGLKGDVARVFGDLLTFAAYLGGTLKSPRGELSVTVKNGEGSVSVSCDADLHVRGCVGDAFGGKLSGGTITVISDDGYSQPFVGTCLMESDDLNENLQNYFRQSEQVVTFVKVGCNIKGDKCLSAGAVIGSCLPEAKFAEVEDVRQKIKSVGDVAQSVASEGAESLSQRVFGGEGLLSLQPVYKCNCSRQKIERILRADSKDELKAVAAELGCVSVHCAYCNKDYIFYDEDIDKLF